MANNPPKSTPPEGLWVLDDTGNSLRYMSEEKLSRTAKEVTDDFVPIKPSAEDIGRYFSTLTPAQKKMQDQLRDLDWNDAAVHNILTILEDVQRYNRERLHEKGCAEDEIQRLDALANENVIDFSHLRRGLTSAGEEDYQLQLYLLEEVKRRRVLMLGEEGG
ncbi:hypothetical protein N7541_006796 [Penicillium brevicompactum]|uniref:Uncharacterized protein n=1 Tax=Penicillium brevicompactum TaxID=5074 RepID=A0A9W9R5S4_PENBR|nr:hypothetical protein N7541_006796 [Penicillium brevicompactum]